MSLVKTKAYVLRTIKFSDSSRIITLYTEELGKLTVMQKGARKKWQDGSLGTFGCIEAMIYCKEGREIQLMSKAVYIETYRNIEKDLERLGAAFVSMELLNKCSFTHSANREVFEIIDNFFRRLDQTNGIPEYTLLKFLIEFSSYHGIIPDVFSEAYETFFRTSGFTLNKSDLNFLRSMRPMTSVCDLNLGSAESKARFSKLCRIYEQYLLDYSVGRTFQKTRTVFDQF
jgi:recombinational DNA repair protein (RecF pathway)